MADARPVVLCGPDADADSLRAQGIEVARLPPPRPGLADATLGMLVVTAADDRVEEARQRIAAHLAAARPEVVAVAPAGVTVRPGPERWVAVGGPPREWSEVHDAVRAAVCGACILEGWADDAHSAADAVGRGDVRLISTADIPVAAPGAMAIAPSTPCWWVRDDHSGREAAAPLLPAGPAALWRGRADDEALGREHDLAQEVAPALAAALRVHGPIDVRAVLERARTMGDDGHRRTEAASIATVTELLPALAERSPQVIAALARGPMRDGGFGLGIALAAARAILDGIAAVPGAAVLIAAAGDGSGRAAVRVAGVPGRWFAARTADVTDGAGRTAVHLGDTPLIDLAGLTPAAAPLDIRATIEVADAVAIPAPVISRHPSDAPLVRPLTVPSAALEAALSALVYALEASSPPAE